MTTQQHPHTPAADGYGIDLGALTAACTGPDDRQAAWRFATAFARDWSGIALTEGDGVEEAELGEAEARLGLRLPAALREAYLLLGRREDLTSRLDTLLAPDELYLDGDRGVLVFRVENQSCAYWGVRVGDLGRDDPPVVVRPDVVAPIAEHWEPWLERVSLAFTEILLAESMDGEKCADAIWDPGEEHYAILERDYLRLPLPSYPPAPDPGSRWYAGPGVLLLDDSGMILVRGRTAADFEAARDAFPDADWLDPR